MIKKVKKLKKGSKIAILSPSAGLPSLFPEIYELGLENLKEQFGFELIEYPTARMTPEELYRKPELRGDDLNQAFMNDEIDGIICSIGGIESVRILEYIDEALIMNHPKFIMGFSDATTFLTYLNQLGMVTFYGPSVMAGFAQLKYLPEEQTQHLEDMLFNNMDSYIYKAYDYYTDGYKDWANLNTLGECLPFKENKEGLQFLLSKDTQEGELWGGCIEVLETLKGTKYWPSIDFWQEKILFLETSEEKPTPSNVGCMLRNYATQGILNKIKGLIIARPKDYTEDEKQALQKIVIDILTIECHRKDLPVIFNMDFGHTDPKLILPLGCKVRIEPKRKRVVLMESPFVEG